MRSIAVALALWALASPAAAKKATASGQPPNIVLLVVDDLGAGDVWHASSDMAKSTPNLAQLASEGVKLDNFYASPECTPSRAMLMTGRHSIHTGLQDSVIHGTEPRGLPLKELMLPSVLSESFNYRTIAIGKWHLGFHQSQYLPRQRGFDSFYGILTGGGSHYAHTTTEMFSIRGDAQRVKTLTGTNLWENDGPVAEQPSTDLHTTVLYNQRAVKMVDDHDFESQPLFMFMSWQAVHGPIQADIEYLDGTVDNGCNAISVETTDVTDQDVNVAFRGKLCGMMSMVDEGVGQLKAALVKRDQWEQSLVVMLSDNGGVKRHGSSNAPYKGQKGEYFEGGVRVPALFSGGFMQQTLAHNNAPGGRTCKRLFHITDVFSTLLRVAAGSDDAVSQVSLPNEVDGLNLWDSLVAEDSTPVQRDELLINMNSDMWGGGGAMIVGHFKMLIENSVGDSVLYRAGREYMAASLASSDELSEKLEARRKEVFSEPIMHLYDLDLNPAEDDSGTCEGAGENPAACTNLWDHPDYTDVQKDMMRRWADYRSSMAESNELWKDDGPLADPDLFEGTWAPWLDETGVPYALYYLAEASSA